MSAEKVEKPRGIYQHSKTGRLYTYLNLCENRTNDVCEDKPNSRMVCYLDRDQSWFVRDSKEFHGYVDLDNVRDIFGVNKNGTFKRFREVIFREIGCFCKEIQNNEMAIIPIDIFQRMLKVFDVINHEKAYYYLANERYVSDVRVFDFGLLHVLRNTWATHIVVCTKPGIHP